MLSTTDQAKPGLVRRARRWTRRLIVFSLLLAVAAVAAGVTLEAKLRRIEALPAYPGQPPLGTGTNWLLVGSDSRSDLDEAKEAELATGGDSGPPHSDTVVFIHLPESGEPAGSGGATQPAGSGGATQPAGSTQPTLVSLPRDSYLTMPGGDKNKLNASYAFDGPKGLVQTVEQATGLRVDHYAEIGFAGFADLVDALGGLDFCLEQPIDDALAGVDLPVGCQHLTGPQALGVVRSRASPRADLDRMARQRAMLTALFAKIGQISTAANPFRVGALWRTLTHDVSFDAGTHVWQLIRLADAMGGQVNTVSAPIGGFADTDVGNVVLWDKDKAEALFASLG